MCRLVAPPVAVVVLCASASVARADGGDPAAAAELFRQGRAALLEKRYDMACPQLAESQRLDPKVGTLINLARCEESTDKRASAMRHWEDAVRLAHANGDARESFVSEQLDALSPGVPRLTIRLAEGALPGARVTLDGAEVSLSDLGAALPVDAGLHAILVSAPSMSERRIEVTLVDEDAREITIDPRAAAPIVKSSSEKAVALSPSPRSAPGAEGSTTARGGTQRTLAYVAAGASAFALGLGTAWGLQALAARNDSRCASGVCDPSGAEAQREGVDAGNRSTVALIVGGALLGTGVVLWLTTPRSTPVLSAWISPAGDVAGVSVGARGSW
jgi:hypothetical protein